LPYNTTSVSDTPSSPPEFNEWLSRARKLLDERLFGMENVKEELLIAAANRFTSPNAFVSIALEGPPGVGKTAIASVFAEIMNLPFERISLGGIDDSSILKGSNTQWVGSRPSTILETLGRFKVSNGVILFDEIDKIGDTPRGHEVVGALIHITDYTQNNEFRDAFISEFTHDISKLWFMFSMNDSSALNPILRDRLHIIKLDAYTANELKTIFRQYVFPRALCNVGIDAVTASQITVSDDALDSLISREMNNKTKTGVRHIERHARTIASRINFLLQLKTECVTVKPKFFIENFSLPRELSRKDIETFIGPAPQKEVLSYFI
jgi:ATP-dependent Lon protease